jgi:hypothetical protein
MAFTAKIIGVDAILRKVQQAPEKLATESIKIINESVKEVSNSAKTKVPVKTGFLKGSIGFSPYQQGQGASVYASAHYAPYVEFGTGEEYGIPVYPNVNMSDLEAYAFTFKRKKQVIGMPYRPYMFNSYSEVLGKMINKIKKIRI